MIDTGQKTGWGLICLPDPKHTIPSATTKRLAILSKTVLEILQFVDNPLSLPF